MKNSYSSDENIRRAEIGIAISIVVVLLCSALAYEFGADVVNFIRPLFIVAVILCVICANRLRMESNRELREEQQQEKREIRSLRDTVRKERTSEQIEAAKVVQETLKENIRKSQKVRTSKKQNEALEEKAKLDRIEQTEAAIIALSFPGLKKLIIELFDRQGRPFDGLKKTGKENSGITSKKETVVINMVAERANLEQLSDLHERMAFNGTTSGIFISIKGFEPEAIYFAIDKRIQLVDAHTLAVWSLEQDQGLTPVSASSIGEE